MREYFDVRRSCIRRKGEGVVVRCSPMFAQEHKSQSVGGCVHVCMYVKV